MLSDLHCGVDLKRLRKCKPPKAELDADTPGPKWAPIAHADLIAAVEAALKRTGLGMKSFKACLSRGELDLTASMVVFGAGAVNGVTPCLGITASNARRGMRVYCGGLDEKAGVSVVFDCFTGFRYTSTMNLERSCSDLINQWFTLEKTLGAVTARLKRTEVTPETANRILIYAGREKIVPWAWVGKTDSAFRRGKDKSQWGLLAAFAPALGRAFPTHQMSDALRLYNALSVPSNKKGK